MQAKFGSRIRSSKRRELKDTRVQRMLTQSIPLHLAKEKVNQVHEMVVSSAEETAIFT